MVLVSGSCQFLLGPFLILVMFTSANISLTENNEIAFKDEEISGIGVLIFWVEISPIQMGWQGLFQYETMTLSKCWWDAPNSAGFCND